MPISLYDANDVIPGGFEGTAFEPILKALEDISKEPFNESAPARTLYRITAIYAIQARLFDMMTEDSTLLNALASALRIPSWRKLNQVETSQMRGNAARTLRVWLNYRGITGGLSGSPSAVVYGEGYNTPVPNSFIDLLLAGGARAVSVFRSGDGKDTFRIFADRPDDLLFFEPPYDPSAFDENFDNYIKAQYSRFLGIFGSNRIAVSTSVAVENTELYSIGSNIQYEAIHDHIRNAYSIDGGASWIAPGALYDNGLTSTAPYFGPLHEENVSAGELWDFVQDNATYLIDSGEAYPLDAPYTRIDLASVTINGGSEMHGYSGTYIAESYPNSSTGLAQPCITPTTQTLPSFGHILYASVNAYFIESDLDDITVYTKDTYTATPAWSYTWNRKTWYFVKDRIGYDKKWAYGEAGLDAQGYTLNSSPPFPIPIVIGVTTAAPVGTTKITSGYWWLYAFNGGSSMSNLWDPAGYASSSVLATSQQEAPGGSEYEDVKFWDGASAQDFSQSALTLMIKMYNTLPEIYTSSQASVTGANCGIIIKPGSAPTWTNDREWDLPSDLYTLSGTTLTWNTSHPLYNLLFNQPGSARND